MPNVRFHILAILLLGAYPLFGQSVRLSIDLDRELYWESAENNLYLQATINVEGENNGSPTGNDFVFLVDRSGSMDGEKLEQAKYAIRQALTRLSSNNTVSVIAFGSTVEILIPQTPVDQLSIHSAAIENLTIEGGSALHEGISTALDLIQNNIQSTKTPRVILITDGPPNKGPRDPGSFATLFSRTDQQHPELTSLFLATGTTKQEKQSLGMLLPSPPVIVDEPGKLSQVITDLILGENPPAVTDAILEISFDSEIEIEESIGRESEISGRKIRFHFGDLRANQELKAITQATVASTKSIHSRTRIASVTLTYNPSGQDLPTIIRQEVHADFTPSAAISFDSIQTHIYQAVCEGEVADTLKESNQSIQEGQDRKALRELKRLSRDLRSIAIDLEDLQIEESINQINLAIQQIEDTRDSSIERAARDQTLYPLATSQTDE